MKTKITLMLAAAFVFFGAQSVKADEPVNNNGNSSDNVTLNIKLHPIQTLIVSNGKTVDIEYKTKDDYANGVTASVNDHLIFYSTGAFEINVKSVSDKLIGKEDNIALSDVLIKATEGSAQLTDATYSEVTLAKTDNTLVSSTTGAVNKSVNVSYSAAGESKYVDLYTKDENPTTFTTQVTYSIVAK